VERGRWPSAHLHGDIWVVPRLAVRYTDGLPMPGAGSPQAWSSNVETPSTDPGSTSRWRLRYAASSRVASTRVPRSGTRPSRRARTSRTPPHPGRRRADRRAARHDTGRGGASAATSGGSYRWTPAGRPGRDDRGCSADERSRLRSSTSSRGCRLTRSSRRSARSGRLSGTTTRRGDLSLIRWCIGPARIPVRAGPRPATTSEAPGGDPSRRSPGSRPVPPPRPGPGPRG
jgi:hypothetical protein